MTYKSLIYLLSLTSAALVSNADFQLQISPTETNSVEVQWPSLNNRQYQVKGSDDLSTWSNHGVPLFGDNAVLTSSAVVSNQVARYFKVIESEEFTVDLTRFNYGTVGAKWTYNTSDVVDGVPQNYTETIAVSNYTVFAGQEALALTVTSNGVWTGSSYVSTNFSGGILELGSLDSIGETEVFTPYNMVFPSVFTPENIVVGSASSSMLGAFDYANTVTVDRTPINTGVGLFSETLKIVSVVSGTYFDIEYTVTTTEWYALDIGLIRSESSISYADLGVYSTSQMTLDAFELP